MTSNPHQTSALPQPTLRARFLAWLVLMGLLCASFSTPALEPPRVDEITGRLEPDQIAVYDTIELKRGETLYVYVEGTSGGLDPLVALLRPRLDLESIDETLSAVDDAVAERRDPLTAIREVLDSLSVTWNDDLRGVYDAAIEFVVPADGTYQLMVAGSVVRKIDTAGRYRLLVGVDAPAVLGGQATPVERLVSLREIPDIERAAEELKGTLTERTPFQVFQLGDIDPGDTLYVYAEGSAGFGPAIALEDYSAKPIVDANFSGEEAVATLEHTFDQDTTDWRIRVRANDLEGAQTGEFRLIVGFNTPEVLQGQATEGARAVTRQPIPVRFGIKILQIVEVDQQSENYTVVGDLIMKWRDPDLAYEPDLERPFKFFTGDSFHRTTNESGILWPQFLIFNQQGRRALDTRSVAVFPNGDVRYTEQFTATLQAPDFNFRRYPFDTQHFFISIDLLLPVWYFLFEEIEGFSKVGDELGEEEWIVDHVTTSVGESAYASRPVSRFTLSFDASRHLYYYIFRIFLPIIIITVSWVLFYLHDYGKRIDAAAANLLLFIAFNFTISRDLPRLGYLTLIDMFLVSTFIVTALVLVLSVYLKRMEYDGRIEMIQRIDRYVLIFYPFAYISAGALVLLFFG